jgi:predicted  nucleic acid-binding Zn-ribbon protein
VSEAKTKVDRLRQMLVEQKASLESAIDDLKKEAAPFRKERDALQEKLAPINRRIYELNALIKEIEHPELGSLETQLNAINKALSDKVMKVTEKQGA